MTSIRRTIPTGQSPDEPDPDSPETTSLIVGDDPWAAPAIPHLQKKDLRAFLAEKGGADALALYGLYNCNPTVANVDGKPVPVSIVSNRQAEEELGWSHKRLIAAKHLLLKMNAIRTDVLRGSGGSIRQNLTIIVYPQSQIKGACTGSPLRGLPACTGSPLRGLPVHLENGEKTCNRGQIPQRTHRKSPTGTSGGHFTLLDHTENPDLIGQIEAEAEETLKMFPVNFRKDSGFQTQWLEWVRYRNVVKSKPVSAKAAKKVVRALYGLSIQDAIHCLKYCAEQEWEGVFVNRTSTRTLPPTISLFFDDSPTLSETAKAYCRKLSKAFEDLTGVPAPAGTMERIGSRMDAFWGVLTADQQRLAFQDFRSELIDVYVDFLRRVCRNFQGLAAAQWDVGSGLWKRYLAHIYDRSGVDLRRVGERSMPNG